MAWGINFPLGPIKFARLPATHNGAWLILLGVTNTICLIWSALGIARIHWLEVWLQYYRTLFRSLLLFDSILFFTVVFEIAVSTLSLCPRSFLCPRDLLTVLGLRLRCHGKQRWLPGRPGSLQGSYCNDSLYGRLVGHGGRCDTLRML